MSNILEKPNKAALNVFIIYLILIYSGLPDILPIIGVLRPGLICTVTLLILWLRSGHAKHDLKEIEAVMIACIIIQSAFSMLYAQNTGAVRHFLEAEVLDFVGLTLGAMVAVRTKNDLQIVLKVFVILGLMISIQVIKNGGIGPSRLGDENDVSIPLLIIMAMQWSGIRYYSGLYRYLCLLGVFLALVAVITAGSRGGFLTLLGVFLAMLMLSKQKFKLILAGSIIAAIVFAFFVSDDYIRQMSTITDTSESTADERLYSWELGVEMFLDNPVLGLGTAQYGWSVSDYQKTRGDFEIDSKGLIKRRSLAGRTSHSTYIDYLSERGLLGMIFIVIIVRQAARRLKDCRKFYDGSENGDHSHVIQYFGVSVTCGISGLLVGSVFVTSFYFPSWWLFVGLIIAAHRLTIPIK